MTLGDLDIFRTRGRAAKPMNPVAVRDLVPSDMEALGEEKGSAPSAIKRISDRHHALARNLASGMSERDAGIICGLCSSRVSILKADPAFQQLLNFYRDGVTEVYRDMHEKLAGISSTALDELSERLEETPEKVTTGQLLDVIKMGADRTGFGPQTTSTNLNVNVDLASKMKAARERVAERTKTIDGEITDIL